MSVLQSSLSLIAQPSLTRMMMNELGRRTSLKSFQSACNRMRFACRSRNIYTAGHFWPHSSHEDHLRDWEKIISSEWKEAKPLAAIAIASKLCNRTKFGGDDDRWNWVLFGLSASVIPGWNALVRSVRSVPSCGLPFGGLWSGHCGWSFLKRLHWDSERERCCAMWKQVFLCFTADHLWYFVKGDLSF